MSKIDDKWFLDRLRERGMSQTALAKALKRDKASVTRMLQGRRDIQVDEVHKLAALLGSTVEEVTERATGAVYARKRKTDLGSELMPARISIGAWGSPNVEHLGRLCVVKTAERNIVGVVEGLKTGRTVCVASGGEHVAEAVAVVEQILID